MEYYFVVRSESQGLYPFKNGTGILFGIDRILMELYTECNGILRNKILTQSDICGIIY